jgi:hypothetical protein
MLLDAGIQGLDSMMDFKAALVSSISGRPHCAAFSWPQQIVRTSERLRWPSNRCVNVPENLKSWHPIEDFRMLLPNS